MTRIQPTIRRRLISALTSVPTPACKIQAQHGPFGKVTWSPDGTSLAWSDSNGIWVSSINTASAACGASPRLIVRGGANPFWGPAGVS